MRRSLALLLLSVALLLQAAAPALAALSSDCLCAEGACDVDAAQPCADGASGCYSGSCARSFSALTQSGPADLGFQHTWDCGPPSLLTAHPPDSDLRPPIA